MPLKVACFCSYLATIHTPWRQEDWDAHKFVHALKGHELRGYCHVPVQGVSRRLSNQNLGSAVEWFALIVCAYLTRRSIGPPLLFVPIPNSACSVRSGTKPHTRKLAKAICDRIGDGAKVVDCLRWKKDLGSASKEGGPRDAGTIYKNLVLLGDINDRSPVVLVDDVMTSGGHVQASAAKIREAGANVVIALCGGRTTYLQKHGAFEIVEETLEDYP